MARNSEKAQSMLFRFRAAQAADLGIIDLGRTRRPKSTASTETIPASERWRSQVLKEISRKVTRIQDPSLSDFQLRDLNDEINRLMREKGAWERRIRELGGPNYGRGTGGGGLLDEEGREIPGTAGGLAGRGYRYYGRARELPGVKEMFEAAASSAREENRKGGSSEEAGAAARRAELRRQVDAAYYGYNLDEEDGTLLAYEATKEQEARERMMGRPDVLDGGADGTQAGRDEEWEELPGDAGDGVRWRLPTMAEVQEELVDRRRRRLLDKLG